MSPVAEAPRGRPRPDLDRAGEKRSLARLADAGLIVAFLALTFLLGVFPLKDTDFWWHLRAGDLIRQTGRVPTVDTFTFGAAGHRWIDLHWIFQVLLSVGYERVGVPGLNVAKCLVTCLAVGLLVTARKREWPVWVMLVAWLPALLVLSGRMYVRPETLTLLYLSMFLAILFRIEERPRLALLLPLVQVAWVNTQGLFILGPAVLVFALIGLALRRGAFAAEARSRWRTVLTATFLVGLACLVNPYGLAGALYPLQLAATMGSPIFSKTIGELKPLDDFIREAGFTNAPLQVHLATIALGVLSFLIPLVWRIGTRSRVRAEGVPAVATRTPRKSAKAATVERMVGPSVFRLLLFLTFTALSWAATRNSHQFAAVVGAVTAWNFGEWGAEIARRRALKSRRDRSAIGRAAAFGAIAAVFGLVASGGYYVWMAEERVVGLGEEPYWFPHEAVAFAGRPDMPRRSLCFHNGHAALYEYAYAPERQTYADARLEVMGVDLYKAYVDLDRRIAGNAPGWEDALEAMGRPLVLVDNVQPTSAATCATLMASRSYRCVWFDPIATLFVHRAYTGAATALTIDFAERHFQSGVGATRLDETGETMLAKTCWNLLRNLATRQSRRDLTRALIWIGLDHARAVREIDPDSFDGWKWAGMLESMREPSMSVEPIPRFRMVFDPVFDLSTARASYAFKRALGRSPEDGNSLLSLAGLDLQRGLYEPALARLDRFLAQPITTPHRRASHESARLMRDQASPRLGEPPPSLSWANLSELDRRVNDLYAHGRAATAADLLESAYPRETRPWEVADRVATIWLHLGEADRAYGVWSEAAKPPSEAVRLARMAAARFAMTDHDRARDGYRAAIGLDPTLFEARYGLAVLESDLGRAAEALDAARAASKVAPHDAAKSAVDALIEAVAPYAR